MKFTLIPGFNPGPYTGTGNATYLIGGREPTLIDAATGHPCHVEGVAHALEGATLSRVLVTHSHADHSTGALALARRWPKAEFWKLPRPSRDHRVDVAWQALKPNDVIGAGDTRLRVVHTPGHSADHLCFFEEADRVLFCGDLIVDGHTALGPQSRDGNLAAYLHSLEITRGLQPKRVLPAHGPEIDDFSAVVDHYAAHCRRRQSAILSQLRSGAVTCDDLVDKLYAGVTGDRKPAAAEMVLAHLLKLRDEGIVRATSKSWSLRANSKSGVDVRLKRALGT